MICYHIITHQLSVVSRGGGMKKIVGLKGSDGETRIRVANACKSCNVVSKQLGL